MFTQQAYKLINKLETLLSNNIKAQTIQLYKRYKRIYKQLLTLTYH